uniref:Uncharacterized protein n=1 Tax=Arundo donax TaxID=35708 RepID=A0A0A8YDS0_ARUDO
MQRGCERLLPSTRAYGVISS